MLVLSRKANESVYVGEVKVMVVAIRGDKVRIGIEAQTHVPILREELRLPAQPVAESTL